MASTSRSAALAGLRAAHLSQPPRPRINSYLRPAYPWLLCTRAPCCPRDESQVVSLTPVTAAGLHL